MLAVGLVLIAVALADSSPELASVDEAMPFAVAEMERSPWMTSVDVLVQHFREQIPLWKAKGLLPKAGLPRVPLAAGGSDEARAAAIAAHSARIVHASKLKAAAPFAKLASHFPRPKQAAPAPAPAHANHKRSLLREPLGANGDYHHCENAREVAQLRVNEFPDVSLLHPQVELILDEKNGSFDFVVEVPYVPFDARYVISFERTDGSQTLCSSNYDTEYLRMQQSASVTPTMKWGHAPNANYRDAFSSFDQFGAYFCASESKWSARPAGCSHVSFVGRFTTAELLACQDAAGSYTVGGVSYGDADEVASLTGKLYVTLLQPTSDEIEFDESGWNDADVRAEWVHPFTISVDKHESKIAVLDAANGGLKRRIDHGSDDDEVDLFHVNAYGHVETFVRSVHTDAKGKLEIVLQTAIFDKPPASKKHAQPRNMTLARIVQHRHSADFEMQHVPFDSSVDNEPYCVDSPSGEHMLTLQNWRLTARTHGLAYDGDFVLYFCERSAQMPNGAGDACDESIAMHRAAVSVRISNPSVFTGDEFLFHSEITQHRDGATLADQKPVVGSFGSGDRVCMQTYVIGPKRLTTQMEIDLLGAWLCADDGSHAAANENTLACSQRADSVQLVSANESDILPAAERLHVVVQKPGLYGLLSVGVCFDADARFTNDRGLSMVQTRQRYETRISMHSATLRRVGAIIVTPVFEQLAAEGGNEERAHATQLVDRIEHARSQSVQKFAFSQHDLGRAIESARNAGQAFEAHAHRFEVEPRVEDVHLVTAPETAVAIAVITLSIGCVFCAALIFVWRRMRVGEGSVLGLATSTNCAVHNYR